MNTMHLFSGAGGGLLADLILGHNPIIAVEWDKYACRVLRERAADGWFPDLRVWEGDVRLFDPSEYAGGVDCIAAGFPCQDISGAGNQAGVGEGTRSGLYREVLRIADVVRPRYLFLENVSAILKKEWLQTVLQDLASRGYDARWTCLPASATGAPHYRDRWWCLAERRRHVGYPRSDASRGDAGGIFEAQKKSSGKRLQNGGVSNGFGNAGEDVPNADSSGKLQPQGGQCEQRGWLGDVGEDVADAGSDGRERGRFCGCESDQDGTDQGEAFERGSGRVPQPHMGRVVDGLAAELDGSGWWSIEPEVGRTAARIPNRAARIKALGNGQVPIQAATAWAMLGGPIDVSCAPANRA